MIVASDKVDALLAVAAAAQAYRRAIKPPASSYEVVTMLARELDEALRKLEDEGE